MKAPSKQLLERVFMEAVGFLRVYAPIAKVNGGNLRYKSIKYYWKDENSFVIYVDAGNMGDTSNYSSGQAPYVCYTNEKWISPKWNGKKNPNESWWNKAIEFIMGYISVRLTGENNIKKV